MTKQEVVDCISRERAIEIVKRAETKEVAYLELINLEPKEIPTCDKCRLPECLADKQDDWIPVSERLPEERDEYLVTYDNMHDLLMRLKSGREFRFSCKKYTVSHFKMDGTISEFSYEGGIGECPIYFNVLDIEAIIEITKGEESDGE